MSMKKLMEQNATTYQQYCDGLLSKAECLITIHASVEDFIQKDMQAMKNELSVYGIDIGKRIIGKLKFTFKVNYLDADKLIIDTDEIQVIANNYNTSDGFTKSKQEATLKANEKAIKQASPRKATSFDLLLKDIINIH